MRCQRIVITLVTSLALGGLHLGCSGRAETRPAAEPTPVVIRSSPVLRRVAVIGASATDGFGASITVPVDGGSTAHPIKLGDVVRASILDSDSVVETHGDSFFFMQPDVSGPIELDAAVELDATLVIAVDYLFWYGYGTRPDGARLDALESGLAQLDRLTCPILVGDFPDMSDAIGTMLSARQVPSAETLHALNERLLQWADERPHVTLMSLSSLMDALHEGGPITLAGHTWSPELVARLLQPDKLHPSGPGLIAITQQVIDDLTRSNTDVPLTAFTTDPEELLRRLRAALSEADRED